MAALLLSCGEHPSITRYGLVKLQDLIEHRTTFHSLHGHINNVSLVEGVRLSAKKAEPLQARPEIRSLQNIGFTHSLLLEPYRALRPPVSRCPFPC